MQNFMDIVNEEFNKFLFVIEQDDLDEFDKLCSKSLNHQVIYKVMYYLIDCDIKFMDLFLMNPKNHRFTQEMSNKLVHRNDIEMIDAIFKKLDKDYGTKLVSSIISSGNWRIIKSLKPYINRMLTFQFYKITKHKRHKLYKEFLRIGVIKEEQTISFIGQYIECYYRDNDIKISFKDEKVVISYIYFILETNKIAIIKELKNRRLDYKKILKFLEEDSKWFARNAIRI